MKKNIHFLRYLLLAILCSITALFSQAVNVNIAGLSPTIMYCGETMYEVKVPEITISLSMGTFYRIYIDDIEVAYNSTSDWSSYTVDIAKYLDGQPHKLALSGYDYGICYFQSDISHNYNDGVYYSVEGTSAVVLGALITIEDAYILDTYKFNGISYPVTKIGDYAFSGCKNLENVTIPKSIMNIGEFSFKECSALVSVNIPETVTSIETGTFYHCSSLPNITIPSSVTYIGKSAFNKCSSILEIIISESVTTIDNFAFYGCSALTSVVIPETVATIGLSAYSGCTSLTSLEFNAENCTTCGSVDKPAFPSSISKLMIGNKVTSIPDYFLYDGNKIETLTIPNSVTKIGKNAFLNKDSKLISLAIGTGLLSIGSDAFSSKTSSGSQYMIPKVFWLSNTPPQGEYNIHAQVNYVSNDKYSRSNQLVYQFLSSKFTVDGIIYVPVSPSDRTCDAIDCIYTGDNQNITIGEKVKYNGIELSVQNVKRYSLYDNDYIQTLNFSNNGNIESYALFDCDNLTSLIASNQGELESYSFQGCDKLASVELKNKGNIGAYAFKSCIGLKTAKVDNDGSVLNEAFQGCTELQTVTLINNGDIGEKAFNGCNSLQSAIIQNAGKIESSAFYNCTSLIDIDFGNEITSIGSSAFYGCSSITNLILPNTVKELGSSAFSGCSAITNLVIPNTVKELGSSAFSGCSALRTINIGTSVSSLPNYIFSGCSSLKYMTIPKNIISVGDYAFKGCSSLGDITIENAGSDQKNAILTLGSNDSKPLFADCPLDEVYIGRQLAYKTDSYYGYSPFYRNTSLRTVEIGDAETQISDNEFLGCSNLQSLKIGNGVKSIGNWAFSGCSALDYFSVGANVETIGEEAFSDCMGLTKFYSYAVKPPVCGNQALDDINKWECTLHVPSTAMAAYRAADQWKDFFFIDDDMNGVSDICVDENTAEVGRYNLQGVKVDDNYHGIVVVRYSDGTTRKMVVR